MLESNNEQHEIYSRKVKAGKRKYFFDVKQTRNNDYYLIITESVKQQPNEDRYNSNRYTKHKIFLYKEDLNKFLEALNQTTDHMKNVLMPEYDFNQFNTLGNGETHADEISLDQ